MLEAIETERLRLSPFAIDDVEAAVRWFADPEVMQFVPSGPDGSMEATRRRVETYRQHQAAHGFSKWVISLATWVCRAGRRFGPARA